MIYGLVLKRWDNKKPIVDHGKFIFKIENLGEL